MTTVRLRPIAVDVFDGATKTGTGAVWADDDPTTYTTLSSSSGSQRAIGLYPVDSSVDGASAITFGMTYDLTSMVGFQAIGVNPASTDGHVNPPGAAPGITTGAGLTYTYTFTDDDYALEGTTLADVVSRFVSGPVSPETSADTPSVLVSGFTGLVVREQWLDFEIPGTPRLRKHPIASTRKWPPENYRGTSLRKVGSYS